jgi:hypothetical protein
VRGWIDTDKVLSGALDTFFEPLRATGPRDRRGVYWLKIPLSADAAATTTLARISAPPAVMSYTCDAVG